MSEETTHSNGNKPAVPSNQLLGFLIQARRQHIRLENNACKKCAIAKQKREDHLYLIWAEYRESVGSSPAHHIFRRWMKREPTPGLTGRRKRDDNERDQDGVQR